MRRRNRVEALHRRTDFTSSPPFVSSLPNDEMSSGSRETTHCDGLSRGPQELFLPAVTQFVEDPQWQRAIRKGLRVKCIPGASGAYELNLAAGASNVRAGRTNCAR